MLPCWLGLNSKTGDSEIAWSLAMSPSGERLLTLPAVVGTIKAPVITVNVSGDMSIRDAASARGGTHHLAAAPFSGVIAASSSVIVGFGGRSAPVFAVAPILRKGQKIDVSYGRGKIHAVSVERVVDDGAATGVWRGFVTAHGRPGEVFLELVPALPLSEGASIRVVGVIDDAGMGVESGRKGRFRRGAWMPIDERIALFAEDLSAEIGTSGGAGADETKEVMGACLASAAALRHERRRTKEFVPFTCAPFGFAETPAQKGFRTRIMAANRGERPAGAFLRGRRMAIPATDWHGAVQDNGDVIIEIRRAPFPVRPSEVTVLLVRTMVTTLDGLPSMIGIRCRFPDGSAVSMLLGGGPQRLAREIARRRNVIVVQGEPGAKTYADIAMFVAGVERR